MIEFIWAAFVAKVFEAGASIGKLGSLVCWDGPWAMGSLVCLEHGMGHRQWDHWYVSVMLAGICDQVVVQGITR